MANTIEVSRTRIDQITMDLVKLLRDRELLSIEISKAKAEKGIGILDKNRETVVLEKARDAAVRFGADQKSVDKIFRVLINDSKRIQKRVLLEQQVTELVSKHDSRTIPLNNDNKIVSINNVDFALPKGLLHQFADIARNAFGKSKKQSDMENHVKGDTLHLLFHDGELAGFASYIKYEYHGKAILYLNGIAINKNYQKNGLFYGSLSTALGEVNPDYLTMRTQSIVVYRATQNLVSCVYPNTNAPEAEAIEIGKYVASKLGMNSYLADQFVERGTYGKSLYGHVPTVDNLELLHLFNSKLGMDNGRGDSIVIVCPINKGHAGLSSVVRGD